MDKWLDKIMNHIWFSIAAAKGDGELCVELVRSVKYHVIGKHQWHEVTNNNTRG
jgi:hypothetical protein